MNHPIDTRCERITEPSRRPSHAVQSKIRLLAGIAINALGALVLFSESFRLLDPSL